MSRTLARGERVAGRLPVGLGSIRARLTIVYSTVLFLLAAALLLVIYAGVSRSVNNRDVFTDVEARLMVDTPDGPGVLVVNGQVIDRAAQVEQIIDQRALGELRRYSFWALAGLFVASLGVGWLVAGRALRPIGRITAVAREIQATDLKKRIDLEGPPDELTELADTFDDMLERLDAAFESERRFIHEASHELRNPLAVIRTNLDVALSDPDASVGELRQTGATVGRSAERMTRLVDDLLLYARARGSLDARGSCRHGRARMRDGRRVRGASVHTVAPYRARRRSGTLGAR